jgi:hypothetical protein
MDGNVTSYNSGTGALVVNVTGTGGSGTFTSWSVRAVSPSGLVAGSTITTATTLTASDGNLRAVNMSTAAQSVTLPNATSISAGRQYTFDNIGGREFGIRDNTGRLVARVGSNLTVTVYLVDNTTAAGVWAVQGQDALLPLTICDNTFSGTYIITQEPACRLTDTLSLHSVKDSSGIPYVLAVDHSTYPATVGTPIALGAASINVIDVRRISNAKAVFGLSNGNIFNVTVSGTTCTVSSSASFTPYNNTLVFQTFQFTGAPTVCNLTDTLAIGVFLLGGPIQAQAIDVSGTNPSVGSAVNIVVTGGQAVHGVYRITDTTALAIYTDDSGTAGAPRSLRAVVLTVTGTSVSAGSSAGVNDIIGSSQLPTCQLSSTSYITSYYQSGGSDDRTRVIHIGVSGTTVTFGTSLILENGGSTSSTFSSNNASRFQPNLFPLTSTTALVTWEISSQSRHVVITNSGGTLTAGSIFYSAWSVSNSGNFPQRSDRFLTISNAGSDAERINAFSISGTTITHTDYELGFGPCYSNATSRFGLSGDYFGIRGAAATNILGNFWYMFKFSQANGLQYLGRSVIAVDGSTEQQVEIAPNKVAILGRKNFASADGTNNLRNLTILEFPL